MLTVYNLFKFLHIVGAIVWIGGVVTVSIITARVAREKDRTVLAAVARQSSRLGTTIIGPAAGLTLIAGIVATSARIAARTSSSNGRSTCRRA